MGVEHVTTQPTYWVPRARVFTDIQLPFVEDLNPCWVGCSVWEGSQRIRLVLAGPRPGPVWKPAVPPRHLPACYPWPVAEWWTRLVPMEEVSSDNPVAIRQLAWDRILELGRRGQILLFRGWAHLGPAWDEGAWVVVG